ncbi:MAG TPA: prolipoprotein diacylglyceryl transferase [Alphaproteobacteria bacterium]|nr:prolipoprotein diacylglyceryl transferase [Alphaproteobacteria bacterium]
MPLLALAFPAIDPIAIEIGPFVVRWYALAYIAGIVLGWRYALYLAERPPKFIDRPTLDDFVVWVTLGVILGGRLGYVLFYKPVYFALNPEEIVFLWRGGMSFHGGLVGVILAIVLFARRRGISMFALGDIVAAAAPIGLFFGRIANFINAELWGRPSDAPWAIVFPPDRAQVPRHPSQLYEAMFEGLVLFAILAYLAHRPGVRERPGRLGGWFLIGYAIARMSGELFREPDAHLGYIVGPVTMGQILSLPMIVAGWWLVASSARRNLGPVRAGA